MAGNSETEINLKTLQRVDSSIVAIIDNASQVAIYKFERELNKWEGTDIEGSLFLYKRSLYPFHGFIIVNRMSTTNFVEPITSDMEFLLEEPYFLYKKSCGEIIGSWFYENKDFRRITNRIQSIVLKQSSPPRRQRCSSDSDSRLKKDENVQDIMTLLSEAHNEYVKTETSSTVVDKNIKEDFNDLSTYTDMMICNKYFSTSEKKIKNHCLHSSSEEKYPISPRRRFLSTGSYDSTSSQPVIPNKVSSVPIKRSKEGQISYAPENFESSLAPTRLSPLFSQDEISSPTVSSIIALEQSLDSRNFKLHRGSSMHLINSENGTSPCDYMPNNNGINKKSGYDIHSPHLEQTLISHVESNSDILLKIHEAYVASLKSLFMQKY